MPLKYVKDTASKLYSALLDSDWEGMGGVYVSTVDGKTYFFRKAFYKKYYEQFIVVYSKFSGYHIFHENDLEAYFAAKNNA